MPTRYTVRFPPALDAAVQEHIRISGTSFAVLIREAMAAYLADTPPTSADTLRDMQAKLAALTARVEVLELALTAVPTPRRQTADRDADSVPTDTDRTADTLPTSADQEADLGPTRQRKLTPRQIRALRDKHRRGVSVPALMDEYGVGRATVFRYLQSEKR